MAESDRIEDLGDQIAMLEDTLAGAQSVASTFAGTLQQVTTTMPIPVAKCAACPAGSAVVCVGLSMGWCSTE